MFGGGAARMFPQAPLWALDWPAWRPLLQVFNENQLDAKWTTVVVSCC